MTVPELHRRITADLLPLSLPFEEVQIVRPATGESAGSPARDFLDLAAAEIDGDDVFVQRRGHWFRVAAPEPAQALCDIMFQLQDDVMDELGRPWPEVTDDDGAHLAVLTPSLGEGGFAEWSDGKGTRCPIGELSSTFGPRVRW